MISVSEKVAVLILLLSEMFFSMTEMGKKKPSLGKGVKLKQLNLSFKPKYLTELQSPLGGPWGWGLALLRSSS